ncbi:MAG: peptidyl-prolyl cis-trans isomerase D, partial [Rickettsiales bacterium]
KQLAADLYQHRFQTREADLVTISMKNIGKSENPNDFELNGFFEKHKNQFDLPELRKVSYIVFGDNYLKPSIKISDDEVALEYESNKDEYTTPETADFYQILFSDESEAKNFYQELKDQTEVLDANKAEIFIKLASSKGKDRSSINLDKISKKLLPKEVANPAFDLSKGQFSEVIESQIGFHVFYLVNKNPASLSPFREVRDEIKKRLLAQKEENQVQNGLRNISNEILATNSLEKVSQTLKMSIDKSLPKFAINGLDSRQKPISDLQDLTDFAKNSFDLEQGKVSKIFASKNGKYYIILVEKIDQKRQRSLDEVRVAVTDMWIKQVKQEKMTDFANKISQEINKEGSNLLKIIAKNGLRIEKNQQFPRFYLIDSGNGKKIPYANELLNEIFALKINQATNPIKSGKDKVVIAVLRSIQSPEKNELETESIASDMTNDLRNDILTSFNQYVQNKFPVEVNEKLMPTEDNKSSDDK